MPDLAKLSDDELLGRILPRAKAGESETAIADAMRHADGIEWGASVHIYDASMNAR
jgi:hypothetical protein